VVEQGTHEQLLARENSLYRHYYALQFRWDEERAPDVVEEPVHSEPETAGWPDLPLSLFLSSGPGKSDSMP
jgi:hypothetical protein